MFCVCNNNRASKSKYRFGVIWSAVVRLIVFWDSKHAKFLPFVHCTYKMFVANGFNFFWYSSYHKETFPHEEIIWCIMYRMAGTTKWWKIRWEHLSCISCSWQARTMKNKLCPWCCSLAQTVECWYDHCATYRNIFCYYSKGRSWIIGIRLCWCSFNIEYSYGKSFEKARDDLFR